MFPPVDQYSLSRINLNKKVQPATWAFFYLRPGLQPFEEGFFAQGAKQKKTCFLYILVRFLWLLWVFSTTPFALFLSHIVN